MDIALDLSNLFKTSYYMDRQLPLLLQYVEQNEGSKIIFPEIGLEELLNNFDKDCEDAKKYARRLKLLSDEDINECKKKFTNHINELKLNNNIEIVPYNNVPLKIIAKKFIKRTKPITGSEKASGFCDALIWHSVMDRALEKNKTCFALISNDQSAFGSYSDGGLYNELKEEARNHNIEAHLFNTVDQFIKEKSALLNKDANKELLDTFGNDKVYIFLSDNQDLLGQETLICQLYNERNYGSGFAEGISLVRPETINNIKLLESKVFESKIGYTQVHSTYDVHLYFVVYKKEQYSRIERAFYLDAKIVISFMVKNGELIEPKIIDVSFTSKVPV